MHLISVEARSAALGGWEKVNAFLELRQKGRDLPEALKYVLEELVVHNEELFRRVCAERLPQVENASKALSGASSVAGAKGSPEICLQVLAMGGDRSKMLESAASQGNLDALDALSLGRVELAKCLAHALRSSNGASARFLVDRGARWQDAAGEIFNAAAKGGDGALDFALSLGLDPRGLGAKAGRHAVLLGNVKLLRRLESLGADLSEAKDKLHCMLTLLRTGNMEMLDWMVGVGMDPPTAEEMEQARSWNLRRNPQAWAGLEAWVEKGEIGLAAGAAAGASRKSI